MKYIRKIILENFQSHKYTEIDLNEKLNIIVGPSDSGKTAILRAIKWLLYNEPVGDFFIREGESEATVTIIFNDNTEVIRMRSKSKNAYEIRYNNGEEIRLEGFGTGVPQEVKEAIGIYKISLDSKESNSINLAEQLEGPFLLSEKTSTRASAIGQLVGVDVIDEALSEILKDTRALNVTKRNLEEEIKNLENEIKTYDFLEELKPTIVKVTDIREKLFESQKLLDLLQVRHKSLKRLYSKIDNLVIIKNRLSKVNEIDEILNILESKYLIYWQLTNYNKNLKKVRDNIISDKSILNDLSDLDKSLAIENKLREVVVTHKRLLNDKIKYKRIKEEKITLNKKIAQLNDYLEGETNLVEIKDIYSKLQKLNSLRVKYCKVKSSINKGNKYIEKFDTLDDINEKDNKLEENIKMLNKLNKLYNKKETIGKNIYEENQNLAKIKDKNSSLVRKYKSFLNNIEKCPLCFSEIDKNKIEHIMDHYIGG